MSETEFESSPDAYKVKLDSFEGPLDLLIHLIRKNEVNVYDIPIASNPASADFLISSPLMSKAYEKKNPDYS